MICVDDERPPYSFVQVQGTVTISEDPADLVDIATRTGARYMGADRADEYGRRNGVPGEVGPAAAEPRRSMQGGAPSVVYTMN